MALRHWPDLHDHSCEGLGALADVSVGPRALARLHEFPVEHEDIVRLKAVSLAVGPNPRAVRDLRVQTSREQRQVADRVDHPVALLGRKPRRQRPMDLPLSRHDMFYVELSTGDALLP